MIIGYSMSYIDIDDDIENIIFRKKFIWKNWNNTIEAAYDLVEIIREKCYYSYTLTEITELNCNDIGQKFCIFYDDEQKLNETAYIIIHPIFIAD